MQQSWNPLAARITCKIIPDGENFIAVKAVAEIDIPCGPGWIRATLESPGLWEIDIGGGDRDVTRKYIADIYAEEAATLKVMIGRLQTLPIEIETKAWLVPLPGQ